MKKQFILAVAAISATSALSVRAADVTIKNTSNKDITAVVTHGWCRLTDKVATLTSEALAKALSDEANVGKEDVRQAAQTIIAGGGKPCGIEKIPAGSSETISATGLGIRGFSVTILDNEGEIILPKQENVKAGTTATWNGTTLDYIPKAPDFQTHDYPPPRDFFR